jgi:hypothetical protein
VTPEEIAANLCREALADPEWAYLVDYYRDGDMGAVDWLAGMVGATMLRAGYRVPASIRDIARAVFHALLTMS